MSDEWTEADQAAIVARHLADRRAISLAFNLELSRRIAERLSLTPEELRARNEEAKRQARLLRNRIPRMLKEAKRRVGMAWEAIATGYVDQD